VCLRRGVCVIGLVLLDTVSSGYELWKQTNGFPKSMNSTKSDSFLFNQNIKPKNVDSETK
jgi:hypothetical protein